MPRTPEQMAAMREWRAYLRIHPLHDWHVREYKSVFPSAWARKPWQCECGRHMRYAERARDAGGRNLKHCGCKSPPNHRTCGACGVAYTPTTVGHKYCNVCASKKHLLPTQRQTSIEYKRAYRAKQAAEQGRTLRFPLHDAHVKQRRSFFRLQQQQHNAHYWAWRRAKPGAEFRHRYHTDEMFRVAQCLRRQLRKKASIERIEQAVRYSFKGGRRAGLSVERLLGYSMAELKQHLERQFVRSMTWDNYGKYGWHIDHIKPKRCFDLTKMDEIRSYWSLPNLRPLWADDNMRKGASVEHLL